ncbi:MULTISPECIES: serine hydrolase domain-containing protein [unclassified Variovorax]|uniref:serine hydrolase domain-containing protein n=1 Tax=unclassified Variovorax TaxID=663243 RepID=UPI000D13BC76|nr:MULTISPECIES: serine hydrolase [unclassified Variovorax]AVQ83266.1 6-aminohexanoate hydrolase [Variovorax sp. PMC12]QRY32427.1 serine hydrolase [Variovorax sp. PDNC026]
MSVFIRTALAAAFTLLAVNTTSAQTSTPAALPDPAATSVDAMGWMKGFPPPPDKLITFDNPAGGVFPRTRWSFSHVRETVPTVNVWRGAGAASPLPSGTSPVQIEAVTFKPLGSDQTLNFAQMISGTYTDGILVMHRGKVVYEKYFGALTPERPHIAMSVTKSFVGTLAAILADEGRLDPAAPVTRYIPELKDTAYGDATVRQVMDMTVGVHYSENYADPKAEIWDYARAGGMLTQGQNYTGPKSFYEFLVTLKKEGEHGDAFAYKTVNAEVLAWILRRASNQSLADLLSEKIWRRIGAEQDAYFMVDRIGTESGGGGLNTVLRDLARFGETMRNDGRASNGQQAIPKAVVEDIRRGGDPAKFVKAGYPLLQGWSYRDMWWVSHNPHGAYMARGIHGQSIYVDPKAEMVIVRYAAHPVAANGANDPLTLPAFQAMGEALMRR